MSIGPAQFKQWTESIQPDFSLKWGVWVEGDSNNMVHEERNLTELETSHLENILVTQNLAPVLAKTILETLKERWQS